MMGIKHGKEQKMEQLQVFTNEDFGRVRTIREDGRVLFCGTDIARALGYSNPRKAVRDHTRGGTKRSTPTDSGFQEMTFIPEGDVYRLIVRSNLPSAEQFERWVFDEVLPTIRRKGGYRGGQALDMETVQTIITQTATAICGELVRQLAPLLQESPEDEYMILSDLPRLSRKRKSVSIISRLEPALRGKVEDMIESERYTYREIRNFLEMQGIKISTTAIGQYAKKLYRF